jgi:mutator protein MutT
MSNQNQIYPEITVGALVFHNSGDILLVKSNKWNNLLSVPGGHIELGERSEDAVVREVKEEVGLDVKPVNLLLVQEAIYPKNFILQKHFIFLDYLCVSKSKEVKLDNREIQSHIWIKPERALKKNLEDYTRNLIHRFLKKN